MTRHVFLASLLVACTSDLDPSDSHPSDPPGNPESAASVTLAANSGLVPQAGVIVIFQNADDSVVAEVMTDATGVATAKLSDGGSVTAIRTDPTGPALIYTFTGVKGGDKLELAGAPAKTTPQTVQVTVADGIAGDPDNPVAITIMTPCGTGTGTSPTIELVLDGCGEVTDFYVIDDAGDGTTSASFLARAKVTPAIDLSSYMFVANLTASLSATNAPAATTLSAEKRLETELFRPVASSGLIDVGNGAADVNLPNLGNVDEVGSAIVTYADGGREIVMSRGPYQSTPLVIDVGPALIARPLQPVLAGDQLAWTEAGTGAPEIVIATFTSANAVRSIAGPYRGTTLRVPHLPASQDLYNAPPDSIAVNLAKLSVGYDIVRPKIFDRPVTGLAPRGERGTVTGGGP